MQFQMGSPKVSTNPKAASISVHGDFVSLLPVKFDITRDASQVRIVNLEGPILQTSGAHREFLKAGPALHSDETVFNFLDSAPETWIFSLANNHAMDFGWPALEYTMNVLEQKGALTVGAGSTNERARTPLILDFGSNKVAIIACSALGVGEATSSSPGIAVAGPWVASAITSLQNEGFEVLVLVHSGTEDHPIPSPKLRDAMKSWVDIGARLCVATHSHIAQVSEVHGDGNIVHGLGNFVAYPELWAPRGASGLTGRSLSLDSRLNIIEMSFTRFSLDVTSECVEVSRVGVDPQLLELQAFLNAVSQVLVDDTFYERVWQSYAWHFYTSFARRQLLIGSGLLSTLPMLRKLTRPGSRATKPYLYDLLAWDVNHELLVAGIGLETGVLTDLRTQASEDFVAQALRISGQ